MAINRNTEETISGRFTGSILQRIGWCFSFLFFFFLPCDSQYCWVYQSHFGVKVQEQQPEERSLQKSETGQVNRDGKKRGATVL